MSVRPSGCATDLPARKPGRQAGKTHLRLFLAVQPDIWIERGASGLMYLDAAEDPTLTMADYDRQAVDTAHLPGRVPRAVSFPEAETRQLDQWPLDPAIRRAIVEDNRVRPGYARIRVPVGAIYRTVTMEQALRERPARTERERAAVNQVYENGRAMVLRWQTDLLAGVPGAKIVELPGAHLYMFLSNEGDVMRELRTFASSLAPPPGSAR